MLAFDSLKTQKRRFFVDYCRALLIFGPAKKEQAYVQYLF